MENILIIVVLAVIFAFAVRHVVKSKKKCSCCIGCPNKECARHLQ